MKKEKIIKRCHEQQELFGKIAKVVEKFEINQIYRITYAMLLFQKDSSGAWVKEDGKYKRHTAYNTVVGKVISFNSESVRLEVFAAQKGMDQYGNEYAIKEGVDHHNRRLDTLSIKFKMLTNDECSIYRVSKDELVDEFLTNIGCEFIHSNFKKCLEAV